MKYYQKKLVRSSTAGTDIFDLTDEVDLFVSENGLVNGMVNIFVPGSTGAITTIEFESGVVEDLKETIEKIAPKDKVYRHDARWGDGNGYSHVRAALLGPSLVVPVNSGRPQLGTWQQVVLCDFDNRPRQREIILTAMGE